MENKEIKYKDLNPYEGINFVERRALIKNKEGKIIFDEIVEFPDFYSDDSVNIVSSKYLCNEAKHKETSLKQMINRVSETIADWGLKDGYFGPEEKENNEQYWEFLYKLKYYQINQYCAFNSPVYFNVGLVEKPQCGACYILDIEDDMESIYESIKIESLIFKHGSGSGMNMSKLRGCKERVRGGGLASGVVSFLKASDVSAGVIRSGGTLRRSAKLVCLNDDHPDIQKFIHCKELEEKKLKILKEAGIKSEEGQEMSDHVFYQNTNISVRLSDKFMKSVEDNGEWWTKYILTGDKCEKFKARELLKEISDLAWRTGDPGVQFSDNINRWNTCKNSGNIEASNPCSEYVFLNSTNCDLASINIFKFFNKDNNINIDIDKLEDVIRIVVTSQDIIIDHSSYPTRKITTNSHNFRPIGLGYSNLGAVLMWLGLPYDSNQGRTIASLLTSLMTGFAFKISNELSSTMGEFSKFEDNKDPYYDVVRLHKKYVDELLINIKNSFNDIDNLIHCISENVRPLWGYVENLINNGMKFRNAQVTLLAPTGTISFLMDCATKGIEPEFSLISYKTLSGSGGATIKMINPIVKESLKNLGYLDHEIEILCDELHSLGHFENSEILKKEHLPIFDTAGVPQGGKRSIDYMGHLKMVAAVQPFLSGAISKCVTGDTYIITDEGIKPIKDFYKSEEVDTFSDNIILLETGDCRTYTKSFYYGGIKNTIKIILGDGRSIEGTPNHKILVANGEELLWKRLDEVTTDDYATVKLGANLWSKTKVKINFKQDLYGSQKTIRIPEFINEDFARLIGRYIAEGNMNKPVWTITITNNNLDLLKDTKRIVESLFGINSYILEQKNRATSLRIHSKSLFKLFEYLGCSGRSYEKEIPWCILQSPEYIVKEFIGGLWLDGYIKKKGGISICLNTRKLIDQLQIVFDNFGIRSTIIKKFNKEYKKFYHELNITGIYSIKFREMFHIDDDVKRDTLIERTSKINNNHKIWSDVFPCYRKEIKQIIRDNKNSNNMRNFFDDRSKNITWGSVKDLCKIYDFPAAKRLIDNNIHFVKIDRIEGNRNSKVYDFFVPLNNQFLGNNVINHNTVNLPNNATVEDIYNLYLESWKMGIKGITIYRDGSKTFQPLNTHNKEDIVKTQPRKIGMPPTRPGEIHKFSIGSTEGYLMTGMYDNGDLGETFLTVSKQGSTLSGLLDMLAIMISISLQHGVPLKTIVAKLMFSRFDPSGITSNPDIRFATSICDYLGRYLGNRYLSNEDKEELGLKHENKNDLEELREIKVASSTSSDGAPVCDCCGGMMQRIGSCFNCNNCGANSGACG